MSAKTGLLVIILVAKQIMISYQNSLAFYCYVPTTMYSVLLNFFLQGIYFLA